MIFCCISNGQTGCTFLEWSVHFLSGQKDYFHVKHGRMPLSLDPVNQVNSHGHQKNHPAGLAQTDFVIAMLKKQPGLNSFYPIPEFADQTVSKLGFELESLTDQQWQQVMNSREQSDNQLLQNINQQDVKIIFVAINDALLMYTKNIRSLDRLPFANQKAVDHEEVISNFESVFYKNDIENWNSLGLNNVWDVRERRALARNLIKTSVNKPNLNFDHYWLDSQNLWYNGQREIPKIMNWLALEIVADRFDAWLPIYHKWQQIQIDALQFQYNYQHIVDSIVNNWPYSIDLTFEQEVIIQHCLIYQHNLNLKTWQLEKFPTNTQDLHKLLEPNIHPL
jgi:hypothetical protein